MLSFTFMVYLFVLMFMNRRAYEFSRIFKPVIRNHEKVRNFVLLVNKMTSKAGKFVKF